MQEGSTRNATNFRVPTARLNLSFDITTLELRKNVGTLVWTMKKKETKSGRLFQVVRVTLGPL